ncbi:hypothetical protein P153DRAFT_122611 [Dothidotthia symphoricarpi CBS 119687]|uniref:Uncharacterized protein n=1 Tax=Dothidotthia symphoricarpi CBS 119687 TaxID=1392245 RepID=A0A6A6A083_9PLEO|nr:uncharacterized protein P153DRAFT_122611 [Dothidotthia symphoricarpi CBS 119687]KAF2125210.1 hypothetical protein P153DRAFT_122611 [Dothidotthia symphoricarpi CBS 119687]
MCFTEIPRDLARAFRMDNITLALLLLCSVTPVVFLAKFQSLLYVCMQSPHLHGCAQDRANN